jgi:hypothetical protein
MPAAFLEEMLELRMEIEELKESGPDSPELGALEHQLVQRRDGLLSRAGEAFARLPEGPERGAVLKEVREQLNATKYVQGLLRDLRS